MNGDTMRHAGIIDKLTAEVARLETELETALRDLDAARAEIARLSTRAEQLDEFEDLARLAEQLEGL